MAKPTYEEGLAAFLKTFRATAPYKHRYEVFNDFITMAACALHNSLLKEPTREQEYLKIIGGYKPDDQKIFPELLGRLIELLEFEPKDVLGQIYMELEIANKQQGQFFTPNSLSQMMAELVLDEPLELMQTQDFITVAEPACGAGGMILALIKSMIAQKLDPAQKLWVQCVDLDRLAALMCYVQLTLWNVPAQIIVGNSLSLETREVWYTPAHHLGFWQAKLSRKRERDRVTKQEAASAASHKTIPHKLEVKTQTEEIQAAHVPETEPADNHFDVHLKREQLGFDF